MTSSSSTTSTRPSPCATCARLPGLPRPCRLIGSPAAPVPGERASCPRGLVILLCLAGPPVTGGLTSPHSSGDRATASGAVCAGSNPAGGAAQSMFFEQTSAGCRSGDKPLTCANADVITFPCPAGARDGVSGAQTCRPATSGDNGCQAVAL